MVSVIIPTYNCGRWLRSAIESALSQTYANLEVIVVDDGSTDDTAAILKTFGDSVRVFSQDNRGVAAARNAGLQLARGKYVAFLDADDKWDSRRLEVMIDGLESGADLAISNYFYIDEGGRRLRERPALHQSFAAPGSRQYLHLLWQTVPFAMTVGRTELFRRIQGFDEVLKGEAEDYDVWLRLLRGGAKWVYVPEPLAEYMVRPGSLSKTYSKNRKFALHRIFSKHADKIGYLGVPILVAYHLAQYRFDMLVVAVRFKNWRQVLPRIVALVCSHVFAGIVVIRQVVMRSRTRLGGLRLKPRRIGNAYEIKTKRRNVS
ncbi:MAG: glycosyltransferase [Syntrophomonadaceae bacterium]|nr:glycosyltransferase [Syntrophomonadaceae bacterium]